MLKKTIVIALCSFATVGFAQKIVLIEGDLKALSGQTSLNAEFKYDDMIVGKDLKEKDYLGERKKELNEKKAGRGEQWEKAWYDDRKNRFEPQFRELFAKHSKMTTTNASAPYTLIFKTTRTEPGWNIGMGIIRKSAFIDAEAIIVDSKDPKKVIARVSMLNVPGRSVMSDYDFDTGLRLQEAYAKAGKELGGFIKSKSKK
jgi:hypothetical protein